MPRGHGLDEDDDDDAQHDTQDRRMSVDQPSSHASSSALASNPVVRQLARGSSLSARVGSSSDGLHPSSGGGLGADDSDVTMRSSSVAPGALDDELAAVAGPSSRRRLPARDDGSKRSTTARQGSTRISDRVAEPRRPRDGGGAGKQRRRYAVDDDDDDDEDEGVGISGARAGHSRHAMRDDDDGDDLEILPDGLDLAAADELFFPGESTDDVDDVKRLSRAWVRERGMAGLTRWQGELVESCLNKLGQQIDMSDTLRTDAQTTDEEHFKLQLVQAEAERVKYLVRAYVRCRIQKVEKFAQLIVSDLSLQAMLSELELLHAKKYNRLLQTHFADSVLNSLPEWLRKTDDVMNDGSSMVRKPDQDALVLVHCLRDEPDVVLNDGRVVPLAKGKTFFVRQSLVERYIQLGSLEIL